MQRFSLFLLLIGLSSLYRGLSAQVGINTLTPDTSAILHLESTNKGFLPPRLTTQQRDNIFSPKPGLTVYNTEDSTMQYYTGRCWLPMWQKSCDACDFDFTISKNTTSIDRIVSGVDSAMLYIKAKNNSTSPIGIYVVSASLPDGIDLSFSKSAVVGSDSIKLRVNATLFAPGGTYPIIIQAACGGEIQTLVYTVQISPCIEVVIRTPQQDYDLQALNNLSSSQPICVSVRIEPGVELTNTGTGPVFTTGNLNSQSKVGIDNKGYLLAKGGAGGSGAGNQGQTGEGAPGTHAIELTVHTELRNTGRIYGGGGGGGSVGSLNTISIPQVGNISIGIGAGGGAGAQNAVGGNLGNGFGNYEPGTDATTGVAAKAGKGGVLQDPIALPLPGVTATINPNVYAGDGGEYGLPGLTGFLSFTLKVTLGPITLLNQTFPNPPLTSFPIGGAAGFAIKRNNNTLIGVSNGNYQTANMKGKVDN